MALLLGLCRQLCWHCLLCSAPKGFGVIDRQSCKQLTLLAKPNAAWYTACVCMHTLKLFLQKIRQAWWQAETGCVNNRTLPSLLRLPMQSDKLHQPKASYSSQCKVLHLTLLLILHTAIRPSRPMAVQCCRQGIDSPAIAEDVSNA